MSWRASAQQPERGRPRTRFDQLALDVFAAVPPTTPHSVAQLRATLEALGQLNYLYIHAQVNVLCPLFILCILLLKISIFHLHTWFAYAIQFTSFLTILMHPKAHHTLANLVLIAIEYFGSGRHLQS